MSRLMLVIAAFMLMGISTCGAPQAPCDDSDPIGICASSHSKTYGG
jgi:hypothetical protein